MPAIPTPTGDYVFPNVTAGTTPLKTMDGFRTVPRAGHTGQRRRPRHRSVAHARTGRRGGDRQRHLRGAAHPGVVGRTLVRDLAGADREPAGGAHLGSFTAFTSFTPGVIAGGASAGGTRLGGAGQNNIMMDGISAMDTGNNGQMIQMNVESIAEVKVLTQGYQAEYGRSSGLRSPPSPSPARFRGSAYDYKINSDWNENSWVNEKNGDPKPVNKRDIYGYSIGGPVGKPGGNNKLFFFYSHEFRPTNLPSTTATRSVSASRPRSSAPATSRRRSTTTATCSTRFAITRRLPCTNRWATAVSRTAGHRLNPGEPAPDRHEREPLPMPNIEQAAGHELQLRGECAAVET